LKYLIDTNIVLEVLLNQSRAAEWFGLDDAYRYALTEHYKLLIVSFDSDFDRT